MPQRHETWWTQWVLLTAAAALSATLLDGFLLQRSRDFFTGGFLSVDSAASVPQALAFLAASLLADVCVLGVAAALLLWLAGKLRLPRKLALSAAFVFVLVPVAASDFAQYQLLSYLGDAFDLGLMFDLAGRDPNEFIAVAPVSSVEFVGAALAAVVAVAVIVWIVKRNRTQERAFPLPVARLLGVSIALLVVGAIATAALRASSDMLDNGLRRKPTGQLLSAMVQAASDVDRDGFGMLGRPSDPDLTNSLVYPYAVDIPGNGVDEDGVAGDLPVSLDGYRERSSGGAHWRAMPDVVLVVLESFRADAFGATLAGKPVTPVLDALAARGITAKHAYSHNGYTVQSRRHIFSGSVADLTGSSLLDDFKFNGYETAYFSAQDESFGGPEQGVGFDRADVSYDARRDPDNRYSTFTTAGSLAVPYNVLTDRIAAFLKKRTNDRPLFLYVNFHDTHFPYHHARIRPLLTRSVLARADIEPKRADELRSMYLNTASNVDSAIGEVLAQFRTSTTREPGVIVLADHGESLFDEGFLGHGYALNDAQTRIPLIVENLPMTIDEPFGQSDLRNAISTALGSDPTITATPVLRQDPRRKVFQYLGTFDRPRQIAFTDLDGRVLYDFRARLARVGGGAWHRPEDLGTAERLELVQLVQTWERMILAKSEVR